MQTKYNFPKTKKMIYPYHNLHKCSSTSWLYTNPTKTLKPALNGTEKSILLDIIPIFYAHMLPND